MSRKRIVLLGATGSIGASTLRVVAAHPDRFEVVGLAAGRDAAGLQALAAQFGVKHLALAAPNSSGIPAGEAALCELAALPEADLVVMAIAEPTSSDGFASGISTLQMIWKLFDPIDCAASMTPPSTSQSEDSIMRATKGAAAMTR